MMFIQEITRMRVQPYEHNDEEMEWLFWVDRKTAHFVVDYIKAYLERFKDEDGELPPMSACADWDDIRYDTDVGYAWADLCPEINAGINVRWSEDEQSWLFGIYIPQYDKHEPDPYEWIDVLWVMKKISQGEYK